MNIHIPVLLNDTIDFLNIRKNGIYLDCTAGFGGHSVEIFKRLEKEGRLIMIDRDAQAIDYLNDHFTSSNIEIMHMNFADFDSEITFDGILLDLGVSSYQIDNADRGFSFRFNAPLDMRMNNTENLSLIDFLHNVPAEKIASIIERYSEQHNAADIAIAIKKAAMHNKMNTTFDLKNAIIEGCRGRGVKFALRRVFQALRIFINDELGSLEKFLEKAPQLLKGNGRIVVISYHSLEDRIVKYFFKNNDDFILINKKTVKPHYEEVKRNKRARSAKLRCAERIA